MKTGTNNENNSRIKKKTTLEISNRYRFRWYGLLCLNVIWGLLMWSILMNYSYLFDLIQIEWIYLFFFLFSNVNLTLSNQGMHNISKNLNKFSLIFPFPPKKHLLFWEIIPKRSIVGILLDSIVVSIENFFGEIYQFIRFLLWNSLPIWSYKFKCLVSRLIRW